VGQDVIYMKNGGILRGTIIDAIPGAQARIQLATGEIATVPWPDIARIEHGNEAQRPAPPSPLPPQPRPPLRSSATVWVHLDGPDEARLQQDATGAGDWTTVCAPPCDIQLPVAPDYRIEGGGLKTSSVFKIAGAQGEHVTVTVNGGSKAWFVLGVVITPIGGLLALIGSVIGLAGSIASSASVPGSDQQAANNVAATGWITFGIGTAALVGGILLIVNNSKTTTMQENAGVQTGSLPADAWRHVPTWREASPEQKSLPPVVGVPLWSGKF
jgi:hypothetical protein